VSGIDVRSGQVRISGVTVKLSNTGKVLFPDDGITKGELIEYYGSVADYMLPYLRDHPIAMARFPDGISKQRIFQKNPAGYYRPPRCTGRRSRIRAFPRLGSPCATSATGSPAPMTPGPGCSATATTWPPPAAASPA
jgi:hypothetical protein